MTETKYARNPLEVAKERTERRRKEFQRLFPHYLPPGNKDGAKPTDWELAQFNTWNTAQDIKEGIEYALRLMALPDYGQDELVSAIGALKTMLRNSSDIPTDLDDEIKKDLAAIRKKAKEAIFEYFNPPLPAILETAGRPSASLPPAATNEPGTALAPLPEHAITKLPSNKLAVLPYDKAAHLFPSLVMAPYQTKTGGQWEEDGQNVRMLLMRDRPDPWEFRLDELDTIIVNIVQDLWLQNNRQAFTVTVNEIARLAFGMEPGAEVHDARRDEVQKRVAYMAGFSQSPDPANLSMYASMGKHDPNRGLKHIFHGAYQVDAITWKFIDSPEPSKLAHDLKRIGHTKSELLTCGLNTARLPQGKGSGEKRARVGYTSARTVLASWLRRRLADYQGITAAKAAQGQPEPAKAVDATEPAKAEGTGLETMPEPRTIYLAKMLADTWEATALPIPINGGACYRVTLSRRIKMIKKIMDDLQRIGAISAWNFVLNLPPPPETVLAAQRWAAANAPETDGRWMAPRGAFIVKGPFCIRIIEPRKTPQLPPGSKRRGRPPKKNN